MQKIKFNKEQKEGLAKFLDSLSAAAVIGGIVGIAKQPSIPLLQIIALFIVAAVMLFLSLFLRNHIEPKNEEKTETLSESPAQADTSDKKKNDS